MGHLTAPSASVRIQFALALVLAAAVAALLRLPDLDERPFHADEAVNALRLADFRRSGHYAYSSHDYHGPVLSHLALPVLMLRGDLSATRESDLRSVTAWAGIGCILLLYLFAPLLGHGAVAIAALALALSPSLVYYSRDFIHEMPFLFAQIATLGCGLRATCGGGRRWWIACAVWLGVSVATKETWVLAAFAALIAALIAQPGKRPDRATLLICIGTAVTIAVALFSDGLRNFAGLGEAWRALYSYADRGAGHSLHVHPWYQYFEWYGRHELSIIVLAGVGAIGGILGKHGPTGKFLGWYSLVLVILYSGVRHKTPWCGVQMIAPACLLAALALRAMFETATTKAKGGVVLTALLLAALLGRHSYQTSYRIAAHQERNPYCYAQSTRDARRLGRYLEALAEVDPELRVQVVEEQPWPLPWELRRLQKVGYYEQTPDASASNVHVFDASKAVGPSGWQMNSYGLEPGHIVTVAVAPELWQRFKDAQQP